ncbi:MAG: hypothetical protein IIX03_01995 [Paludibacteraceae bacterium]|nr:hypothetical protein [Paludibacteraceae bacterium]
MSLFDFFTKRMISKLTNTEQYVCEAIDQLSMGNDGDETYHPLYKAWRSFQEDPEQLKSIRDYGKFGMGLMIFLSYETVVDIDDKQQLASIAYLFLSKAIESNPNDVNLLKNRLILMISNHQALEYIISSVVRKNNDFMDHILFPFTGRDALLKMKLADLSKNTSLLNIDMFADVYIDIKNKITSNFFGKGESINTIIEVGDKHHKEILNYLEEKIIKNLDINF